MKQKTQTASISVRPFPGETLTLLPRADLNPGRERGALKDLNTDQAGSSQTVSLSTTTLLVGTVSIPSFSIRTQWLRETK